MEVQGCTGRATFRAKEKSHKGTGVLDYGWGQEEHYSLSSKSKGPEARRCPIVLRTSQFRFERNRKWWGQTVWDGRSQSLWMPQWRCHCWTDWLGATVGSHLTYSRMTCILLMHTYVHLAYEHAEWTGGACYQVNSTGHSEVECATPKPLQLWI